MTTLDVDPGPFFVLVWREDASRRLRTYASPDGRPLSSPLENVSPEPSTVIIAADALNAWLAAPSDTVTIAVSEDLARSELGWNPERTESLSE